MGVLGMLDQNIFMKIDRQCMPALAPQLPVGRSTRQSRMFSSFQTGLFKLPLVCPDQILVREVLEKILL